MINLFVFFVVLHKTACYGQDDYWNKIWLDHAHYDRGHLIIFGTKDTSGLIVWQNSQGFGSHYFFALYYIVYYYILVGQP